MQKSHERVDIISFCELSPEQQVEELDLNCEAGESNYFVTEAGAVYSLDGFMRTESSRFDGVMGFTNTSAIGLILAADGEEAVIQFIG